MNDTLLRSGDQSQVKRGIGMESFIKAVVAWVAVAWAGLHPSWQALLTLNALDIVSGLIVAGMAGQISSTASSRGIGKKALMWIAVAAAETFAGLAASAHLVEVSFPSGAVVAGFWCVTEVISIFENLGRGGIPLPDSMVAALSKLGRGVAREEKK
jgi:toxin secretion/phage lysis holin